MKKIPEFSRFLYFSRVLQSSLFILFIVGPPWSNDCMNRRLLDHGILNKEIYKVESTNKLSLLAFGSVRANSRERILKYFDESLTRTGNGIEKVRPYSDSLTDGSRHDMKIRKIGFFRLSQFARSRGRSTPLL